MLDLRKVRIFASLSTADAKEILPYFMPQSFKKKEIIFSEGDPSDWLYIVEEGKVKITKVSHEGREIILEIISPTELFGGIAVVRGFPYPANAVAMEDVLLVRISRSNLMRILDTFPAVMFCMAQNIGERLRDSHNALKDIALERVESRIASLLLKLASKAGLDAPEGRAIDMKLTKQDIAEMVGTTVETSIRTMSKLKKIGAVSEKGGRIVIKDAARLSALAGSAE